MVSATARREPDPSRPIEFLRAHHELTRAKCGELRRLVAHLAERGCEPQARAWAAELVAYFDSAARALHEDVEVELLPRMMAASTRARGSVLTRLVADVTNEHRVLERAWLELRGALQELAAGVRNTLDALAVDRFVKLYSAHIALAEADVLPLAEMLLDREDLAAIASGMAARRRLGDCRH